MKIHKQGGNVIYEGKVNIKTDVVVTQYLECVEVVTLTENLSASDKRRKLTSVELSEGEVIQCMDKLGLKTMPSWQVDILSVAGGIVKFLKGLVK